MNMGLARGLRLSLAPTDRGVSKRGGGRKLRTPTSPAAGLHRLAIQAQGIVKDVALLDAPVFDELEDMQPA